MAIRRAQDPDQKQARASVDLGSRLRELQASIVATVLPIVQGSADRITALLNNYLLKTDASNTYSPLGHKHAASDITSGGTTGAGFTVGGSLAVNGDVNPSGAVTAGGQVSGTQAVFPTGVKSTGVYNTVITGTRAAQWVQNDGVMGITSSTEASKTNIRNATSDPQKILGVAARYYQYRVEISKRDDATSDDYVGPDYHVHTEIGVIAEELHAAGLWEYVIYERSEDGTPMLGSDGNPQPISVHYELWSLAVHQALVWVWGQLQDTQKQVADQSSQIAAINSKLLKLGVK